MPDTTVRFFDSTMSGAPSITRVAGSAIGVLDACLKDGFGSVTVNSLAVAANVATATVSAGHNLAMLGAVGPVVRIAGATPSGLNGDWRIASIPNSTTFTFATSGISDQTATGTITAQRAPLGFSKVYSGTNKAAYRADAVDGLQPYLRVDDASTQNAGVQGYMSMSDVDTGSDAFPASAPYLYKIDGSRTSAPWWLIGDDKAFYLFCQTNTNGLVSGGLFFGDLAYPLAGADAYCCGLIGGASGSNSNLLTLNSSTSAALARSYTQLAGVASLLRYSHSQVGGAAYPCPVNNGIVAAPVDAWESSALPRGVMPGMYRALNAYAGFTNLAVFDAVVGLQRSLIFCLGLSQGALFDLIGPWR